MNPTMRQQLADQRRRSDQIAAALSVARLGLPDLMWIDADAAIRPNGVRYWAVVEAVSDDEALSSFAAWAAAVGDGTWEVLDFDPVQLHAAATVAGQPVQLSCFIPGGHAADVRADVTALINQHTNGGGRR